MGSNDPRKFKYIGLADNIFRLYKHNFNLYFKISLIFFLIPIFVEKLAEMRMLTPTGLYGLMDMPFTGPFDSMEREPNYGDNNGLTFCCSMIIVLTFNFILHALYAGPVILATSHKAFDKEISLRATIRIPARTYYYLVMATIGYTVTLMMVYFGSTLFIVVVGFISFLLLPCGCAFLLIPVSLITYVALLYSLYIPAIVLEGCEPRESVRRSARLVKGNWWLAFRVLVGALLIQTALSLSSEIAFRGLGRLIVSWNTNLEIFSQAFSAAGLTLVYMFVRPILFIALTLLFYEIKAKKEAFDLEMMIENF